MPRSTPVRTVRRCLSKCEGIAWAKAALENAVWEMQALRQGVSLSKLLGGTREKIPCGVSIGIQATPQKLMETIEKELAAGYQRIKLKCKPGWDEEILSACVRAGRRSC